MASNGIASTKKADRNGMVCVTAKNLCYDFIISCYEFNS